MVKGSQAGTNLSPKRPRRGIRHNLLRIVAVSGGILIVGGLAAGVAGYNYVRRELPTFLQTNLSAALGRPIKVGEFQRLDPGGIRLGPSILPPTEENFSWIKAGGSAG
jgi:translocation and assembly module TamB